jgi:hypothetical protein
MLTGENKNTVHEQVCELGSLSWHELYIVLEDTCTIRFMITRTLSYQEGWLILLISDHLDISYSGAPEFILSLLWGSYCPIFRFQCSVLGIVLSILLRFTGPSWSWSYGQLPMQSMSITTKAVSSNSAHDKVYSIQHYVMKFVSDLSGSWDKTNIYLLEFVATVTYYVNA